MLYNYFLILIFLLFSCSRKEDPTPCKALSVDGICLTIESDLLSKEEKLLVEELTEKGIQDINSIMPINNLTIRIVNEPNLVIPEIGVGGFNPSTQEVKIAFSNEANNLSELINHNYLPILAHEVHHAKRRRTVGYGNTLLQAMVSEGLADHFAIEVSGISAPPWSVALSGEILDQWIITASETWNNTGYNHKAWFLGTDVEIPRWTGYSIGFELVNSYLKESPEDKASTLHDKPATVFEP